MKRAAAWLAALVSAAALGTSPVWTFFAGLTPLPDEVKLTEAVVVARDGAVAFSVVRLADGTAALVDCGSDPEGARVRAVLASQGFAPADVRAIFLTHGHRDHLGGCRAFSNATVHALAAERDLIEGRTVARGPIPRLRAPAVDLGVQVNAALSDGDTVVVGGSTVRVFAIPGHTQGSAAWLLGGVLFVGDTGALERGGTVRAAPWVFSDDVAQASASLRSLAGRVDSMPLQALVFGHSAPAQGPQVARWRERQ